MDDDAILDAIRHRPAEAADALLAIQTGRGTGRPVTSESIAAAAGLLGRDAAELWLDELKERGLVLAFVAAVQARGVAFDDNDLADHDGDVDDDLLEAFLPRAKAFRCRVLKNGSVAGSGVLVGPSLVLTSWHVIAVDAPGRPQEPAPKLEILLSDRHRQAARFPALLAIPCGDDEFRRPGDDVLLTPAVAPRRDDDVLDRNDVAVLAMTRPAAAHLGFVRLTKPAPAPQSQSRMLLVHYPDGQESPVGQGFSRKIRSVSARWRHDVPTEQGSSGGACFNKELEFLGIHQGKFDTGARFVPVERFIDAVFDEVAKDKAPPSLWSLDGTTTGPLVVGRRLLFEAVAASGEPGSRVRGVWIKRTRIDDRALGLSFSHDILEQLLIRRGPEHRLVRVTQEESVPDLVADIRRRVMAKGLAVPDPPDEPGVAPGAAPSETTAKDRATTLVTAVEHAAAAAGITAWFFFDNPTITISGASRLAFEGFVAAALVQPHVRVMLGGFETFAVAGDQFSTAAPTDSELSPGFVVEYIGGFRRDDLHDLLHLASMDLTGAVDDTGIKRSTKRVLTGSMATNGLYDDDLLPTVSEGLRSDLELLREEGGR